MAGYSSWLRELRPLLFWLAFVVCGTLVASAWESYDAEGIKRRECNHALEVLNRAGFVVLDDEGFEVAGF